MSSNNNTNGSELLKCQKCEYLAELEKLKEEMQITRDYIHDNNLEWDLLSYCTRREKSQKENRKESTI